MVSDFLFVGMTNFHHLLCTYTVLLPQSPDDEDLVKLFFCVEPIVKNLLLCSGPALPPGAFTKEDFG